MQYKAMISFGVGEIRLNKNHVLIGIILIAIFLRMWGIKFGLPYLYHPDEPVNVAIAQKIFKTGDLNPHWFYYPSLFFYINSIAYVPYYLIGKLAGIFSSRTEIPAPMMLGMGVGQSTLPTTFLMGRVLTVAFGAAAIVLVFVIGWKLTGNRIVGLLAGLMMALSPTNVGLSRFITPDTYLVFFLLLAFWGSVQIFRLGKARDYLIAGVASGLAVSTKYNGALIILTLISSHFLRLGLKGFKERNLYLGLMLSAVVFFLSTPFAVLDASKFIDDYRYEVGLYATGHPGMEGNTLGWYVTYLWQMEGPIILVGVAAMFWGVYERSKQIFLLFIFPVSYFVFVSNFAVRNDRTILPLTPFVFLLAAVLLAALFQKVNNPQPPNRWLIYLNVLFILVLFGIPLLQTVRAAIQLTTQDSRATAREWIDRNLPKGSSIAIESYAPYVDPQRFAVSSVGRMIDHSFDWYAANRFTYLVFSEGMFGRFFREPDKYSIEVSQYNTLFSACEFVYRFTDGGYDIRICKLE